MSSTGAVEGKTWGNTQSVLKNEYSEVNRIRTVAGGYCSKHRHRMKHNRFFVLSGQLMVVVFQETGLIDQVIIGPDQHTSVPPGKWHMFISITDTVTLEAYWGLLDTVDIDRESVGGVLQPNEIDRLLRKGFSSVFHVNGVPLDVPQRELERQSSIFENGTAQAVPADVLAKQRQLAQQ